MGTLLIWMTSQLPVAHYNKNNLPVVSDIPPTVAILLLRLWHLKCWITSNPVSYSIKFYK